MRIYRLQHASVKGLALVFIRKKHQKYKQTKKKTLSIYPTMKWLVPLQVLKDPIWTQTKPKCQRDSGLSVTNAHGTQNSP